MCEKNLEVMGTKRIRNNTCEGCPMRRMKNGPRVGKAIFLLDSIQGGVARYQDLLEAASEQYGFDDEKQSTNIAKCAGDIINGECERYEVTDADRYDIAKRNPAVVTRPSEGQPHEVSIFTEMRNEGLL